ncbi:hypothetical protein [Burkholderia metallica]|uniref:hypothetical protein n=1 Tax=Burkholderia metallica TaxID=488729 RepID=UPI0012F4A21C|nr:hypothetical protein [Burkholderia metallica]
MPARRRRFDFFERTRDVFVGVTRHGEHVVPRVKERAILDDFRRPCAAARHERVVTGERRPGHDARLGLLEFETLSLGVFGDAGAQRVRGGVSLAL